MRSYYKNKKILVGLLLLICILGAFGCGKEKLSNPTVQDINDKVNQGVDLSNLVVADYPKLKKLYGISRAEIEDFVLYRAPSNIKADELAIIKVKDPKYIDGVKEKVLQRAARQATSFRDYVPEEYYLIEKKIVKVKGNYILFAVSKDAKKIAELFEDSI
ncbi:hypothetical protein JCM14036_32500 [Desulfotomaculum defluvii]